MDGTTRIGIACLSLVVLWIAVYWLTPAPQAEETVPRVTYQQPLRPTDPEDTGRETSEDPNEGAGTPTIQPPTDPDNSGADPDNAQGAGPKPGELIPPVFVDYTVQEGDNAWSISERFYGSREHWASVLLSNPTIDSRRLFRVGRVIKLAEDPNNIQGIIAGEEPPLIPRMDFIEYRVETGDSLSEISKAIYGRASLWRVIQSANADQVNSNGTNISPGMILKIPPPPAD